MSNEFFKGHGLGNEYIVLDPVELTFKLTPERIAWICDRRKSIGSDGVLTLQDSDSADFGLRIWNPDGSEAETSGNGLRIFACYLHATDRTRKNTFSVETSGGTVRVETQHDSAGAVGEAGTICGATVHMGRATFRPEALPLYPRRRRTDRTVDQSHRGNTDFHRSECWQSTLRRISSQEPTVAARARRPALATRRLAAYRPST